YAVGLPAVAERMAQWMPYSVEARVGEPMLKTLDYYTFRPSALPSDRREAITRIFQEAAGRSAPGVDVHLEFRAGDLNAFALPGGVIVLLDELVEITQDDDELLGVLAHELGHVVHRHPMRQVAQAVGLFAIASAVWGDVSGIAANAAAIVGAMQYSRAFEHEADLFALSLLQREGRPLRALDGVFARLAERTRAEGGALPEFLSSHPETDERRERLRAAAAVAAPGTSPPAR
ncbi:MAG TPA: M48 family metallopeptidase, partial [Casimicrobiaceae bacterium]